MKEQSEVQGKGFPRAWCTVFPLDSYVFFLRESLPLGTPEVKGDRRVFRPSTGSDQDKI